MVEILRPDAIDQITLCYFCSSEYKQIKRVEGNFLDDVNKSKSQLWFNENFDRFDFS